jgi:hypothetical protein
MQNSDMATTFKLFNGGATDGATYIDLPISGRIACVGFGIDFLSGAGGVGYARPELSRVAVNQDAVTNPRGVIAQAFVRAPAASQGASTNCVLYPDEPVKSGERLYLNCAAAANFAAQGCNCYAYITIA